MLHRLTSFLRRHERAEETIGTSIALNLLWRVLFASGLVGAGYAAAAITGTAPRPIRVPVPHKLVLETATQHELVRFARRYGPGSGIVYVWGGDGPFGFDCSGYVNYLYRRAGISIPRDSRSQWTSLTGVDVRKGHEQPGDAVYFHGSTTGANAGPPPGHVGLYIGGGRFIEYYSSGRPAKVALLRDATDYMGAKRWWQPVTVEKRHAHAIEWTARHFHVKIGSAHDRWVTFRPWRGHGRLARARFRRLTRWAHRNGHRTAGNRRHLALRY